MQNQTDIEATLLLNEWDVARITGMSIGSVRRWRLLGQGPRYLKLGFAVRYRPEDVQTWLDSRPSGGELTVRSDQAELAQAAHE